MTIFVDMDEVIADAYNAHLNIYNQEFNAQLTLEDCHGKEFWQSLNDTVLNYYQREFKLMESHAR